MIGCRSLAPRSTSSVICTPPYIRTSPAAPTLATSLTTARCLHPGDSFVRVDQDVDVLAVAIDAPWLKMSESIDYVHTTRPRVAVPIHEAGATGEEADKYCGMLAAFSPEGVVTRLTRGSATTLNRPSTATTRQPHEGADMTESSAAASGRILGLGCGQPDGSAEILLKSALRAAESDGATIEMVRLSDLHIPSGSVEAAEPDDIWWLWEHLVDCDGLIVARPSSPARWPHD